MVWYQQSSIQRRSVTLDGKKSMSINMSFVLYHARMKSRVPLKGSDNPPGAYIFLPDGPASTFDNHASFIVVEGSVMQKVLVAKYANFSFVNVMKLEKMSPSIEIQSTIHLQNVKNIELAMRLETGIDNGEEFFTDLNGYQLVKRYRFKQLPLQAHFYPMPTSAIIEDESFRMTLISAQPLGVANLASGQLDVMLDRRLNQDDGRGLFSGVTDNKKTSNIFRLTVEGINQNVLSNTGKSKRVTAYHSAQTYSQMLSLLYPIVIILTNYTEGHIDSLNVISYKLPCDIHLVTLRTLAAPTVYGRISDRIHSPENSYALVLHRFGMDCRFNKASLETCISSLNIKRLFTKTPSNVTETSLTMLYENLGNVSDVNLETMEVKTFRLDYVL
ncbi:unnamed protein product [Thelazia callipaeda]|uniref:Glyco_hydro_38C domain-containing protein n=1 Tax=Thelazia callipaeda TaxID=103827 RepID=A0A0N5CQ50_THECL|nr:unnamed protein product [Thelazia callipaeda]